MVLMSWIGQKEVNMKKLVLILLVVIVMSLVVGCTIGSMATSNAKEIEIAYMAYMPEDDTFCFFDSYEVTPSGILILDGYYIADCNGNLHYLDKTLLISGTYRIIELGS